MNRRVGHRFRLFLQQQVGKDRCTVTYPDPLGTIAQDQGLIAQNAARLRRVVQERMVEGRV